MGINIEVTGLKELIKQAEMLATPRELEEADKLALKNIGAMVQKEVKKVMPKSKDVSKSGRKGSRTFKHAADNIPVKLTKKDGRLCIVIGWTKEDNSPYFYTKFIEFGTSKAPPLAPFKKTFIKQREEYDRAFQKEYEKLLEKLSK